MAEIKTVQKLIDQRADEKLDSEVIPMRNAAHRLYNLAPGRVDFKVEDIFQSERDKQDGVGLTQIVDRLIEKAKAELIDKFRSQEAVAFLAEFDSLRDQIENVAASVQS